MQNIILNHQEVEHKIKRISYQIYETFVDEKEVIIAGISKSGFILAQKIATELGTAREVVSRIVKKMENQGILKQHHDSIEIIS